MKGDRFYTNLQSSTPGVGNLTSCRLVAEQIQLPIARHTPSRCRLSPRPIPPTPPCAIRLTVCLSVCSSFFPCSLFDFESCGGEANKSKTRNDERTAGPRTTAFFASARAASSCWTLYCTRLATARTRRRRTDSPHPPDPHCHAKRTHVESDRRAVAKFAQGMEKRCFECNAAHESSGSMKRARGERYRHTYA